MTKSVKESLTFIQLSVEEKGVSVPRTCFMSECNIFNGDNSDPKLFNEYGVYLSRNTHPMVSSDSVRIFCKYGNYDLEADGQNIFPLPMVDRKGQKIIDAFYVNNNVFVREVTGGVDISLSISGIPCELGVFRKKHLSNSLPLVRAKLTLLSGDKAEQLINTEILNQRLAFEFFAADGGNGFF